MFLNIREGHQKGELTPKGSITDIFRGTGIFFEKKEAPFHPILSHLLQPYGPFLWMKALGHDCLPPGKLGKTTRKEIRKLM